MSGPTDGTDRGPTQAEDSDRVNHAELSRSFDLTAAAYELGRPEYPDTALDWWEERGAFEPGCRVLDLAAGTGKLTRLLPINCELHAVEPLANMRAEFTRAVPDAAVVAGNAESIPFADDSFDTVLVAQAFHWFDQTAALDEIARVLKPGGGLGLIWNHDDVETAEWLHAVVDSKRIVAASPTDGTDATSEVVDGHPQFGPVEAVEQRWVRATNVEGVLADVLSRSYVSSLDSDARLAVLTKVRTAIEHLGETFDYPYRTTVYWSRLGGGCHDAVTSGERGHADDRSAGTDR